MGMRRNLIYMYVNIDKLSECVKIYLLDMDNFIYQEYKFNYSTLIENTLNGIYKSITLLNEPSFIYIVQPYSEFCKIFKPYRGRKDISSLKTQYGVKITQLCKDIITYSRAHGHSLRFYDRSTMCRFSKTPYV